MSFKRDRLLYSGVVQMDSKGWTRMGGIHYHIVPWSQMGLVYKDITSVAHTSTSSMDDNFCQKKK